MQICYCDGMRALVLVLGILVMTGCGDDDGGEDAGEIDANSSGCQLSGGCDFLVNSGDECPDPINTDFCGDVCAGAECCWCENDEPQVIYIDCTDGCFVDASPQPRDAGMDGGLVDAL